MKEIIKIKEEINKVETQKTIEKSNKTKSWFFEKVNTMDKPLARLTQKRRERIHITKIRNEKGEIDGNTIIVGDFNTPLTTMDRSSRQKISKATEILKDT